MLLLEHDAKSLLASFGVPVPQGVWIDADQRTLRPAGEGPWVVKAQVPAGGRGKAGGIRLAANASELSRHVDDMLGMQLLGHVVEGLRVETAVPKAAEFYLSLAVHPASCSVAVTISPEGGVDIESSASVWTAYADPSRDGVRAALDGLLAKVPEHAVAAVRPVSAQLASAFFELEAMLVEVNPLFVVDGKVCIAGDAKVILDANAFARKPELTAMLRARGRSYPEALRKLESGIDYVVLDPHGNVGVLSSGAGVGMKAIDELTAAGVRPYNFIDMRAGQLRGNRGRVVEVLRWLAQGSDLKVIFMNLFAGLSDMEEFARLLVSAQEQVPELDVPIVARLEGRNADGARRVFEAAPRFIFERDFDSAVQRVQRIVVEGA